ncbi:MAG: tRNA pseudouridine(38-40) synthase TruA [Vicingaceae bacterium]
MRYFLDLQFRGTNYHGWQVQPNANTVQAELEKALSTLLQNPTEIVGAGRTDTGVHAKQMVAHFEVEKAVDSHSFLHRLNSLLPKDISALKVWQVKDDFHARFDASSRSYRYVISQTKDPFLQDLAYYFKHDLDVAAMNQAAKLLLGELDFSCFSKAHTQTFTNNCSLIQAVWKLEGHLLYFDVSANRFLRNMVRAMVGTLIEVGEGRRSVDSMQALIESKNRSEAGSSVPAHGLFLMEVKYPED